MFGIWLVGGAFLDGIVYIGSKLFCGIGNRFRVNIQASVNKCVQILARGTGGGCYGNCRFTPEPFDQCRSSQ